MSDDPLRPSPSLLVKLGSVIRHYDELYSPTGHGFDKLALDQLLQDPELVAWLAAMDARAMLPVKR